MPHARFIFSGIHFQAANDGHGLNPVIQFSNRGEIPATSHAIVGVAYPSGENQIGEISDAIMKQFKDQIVRMTVGTNDGIEINPQTAISLLDDRHTLSPSDISAVNEGREFMFVFAIARFTDRNMPSGEFALSEVCLKLTEGLGTGLPCLGHNSAYQDKAN
jgi:hypothetical protein